MKRHVVMCVLPNDDCMDWIAAALVGTILTEEVIEFDAHIYEILLLRMLDRMRLKIRVWRIGTKRAA